MLFKSDMSHHVNAAVSRANAKLREMRAARAISDVTRIAHEYSASERAWFRGPCMEVK